ncbi:MAG: M18 family aminopeptidase [Clostridia bacterium]|nr:M18 family aminopeptidase [Clostridia bacterium]
MTEKLIKELKQSLTSYHAVETAEKELISRGFKKLAETSAWKIEPNGKYYVVRDGSALVAFRAGAEKSFGIVASHTDSPCFKIKPGGENRSADCTRLEVERYGGGLMYSWLDVPLKIAGRAIYLEGGKVVSHTVALEETFVIPSVAIHFNRTANDGLKFNPQVDMQVLAAIGDKTKRVEAELENAHPGKLMDYDLFVTAAGAPFVCGFDDELICTPRADNLTSVFASVEAIAECEQKCTAVIFLADNEEVGSRTRQGAGSTFLKDVLERVAAAYGWTDEDYKIALSDSFMVSCDNAHAAHPNHPELSSPNNKVSLGGGVVIKHHANQNYTTDAMSSAIVKCVFEKAGVSYQDFFMRSDLPCGGTLGAISSSQLSVRSVDIGIPQLAMHSYAETFAPSDYAALVKGLKAFLSCSLSSEENSVTIK